MAIKRVKFKDIKGYEGKYAVSDSGEVYSYWSDRLLAKSIQNKGYNYVSLWNGKADKHLLHRLVADAFIGGIEGMQVNHIDSDRLNNNLDNLELVTPKENQAHAAKYGSLRNIRKPVMSLKNGFGIVYPFLLDVASNGFTPTHVSKCARGINKTHGGYAWNYL